VTNEATHPTWKWVNPKDLAKGVNKRNWKTHPKRQKAAVKALILKHGWVRPLVWNTRSKRLVDGHCRLEIAIESGWETVPVLYGSWTDKAENELLLTLDTTGNMSQIDAKSLDSLARDVAKEVEELVGKDSGSDELMKMAIDAHGFALDLKGRSPIFKRRGSRKSIGGKKMRTPKGKSNAKVPQKEVLGQRAVEDSQTFYSSHPSGIPDLNKASWYVSDILPDHTFDGDITKHHTLAWYSWTNAPFKEKPDGGFLHYFTEDHRFNRLYKMSHMYVDKFLAWNFHAMVEPDYSTYGDWPLVARQWNIYRARWVSLYFSQRSDVPIIPLIRVSSKPDKDQWMYDILPQAKVFSINCAMRHASKSMKDRHESDIGDSIAKALEVVKTVKPIIILNGGKEQWEKLSGFLPKGPTYHPVETWTTARRRVIER